MEELGGPRLPKGVRDSLRSYRVEARRPVVLGLWLPLVDATEEAVTAQLAPLLSQVRAPYLSLHGDDPGADYETLAAQADPDRAGRSLARPRPLAAPGRARALSRAAAHLPRRYLARSHSSSSWFTRSG